MLKTAFNSGACLMPYFTLGDPDISFTKSLIIDSFRAGADIVELGVPFSDPVADGPIIQFSHQRALALNPNLSIEDAFLCVKSVKEVINKPIVLMAAVNLIVHFGVKNFFRDAAKAGVDGVIMPDLSLEEVATFKKESRSYKVPIILLASTLSSKDRLLKISKASEGFLYLISSTGLTGERSQFSEKLADVSRFLKQHTSLPVAVGFGISRPEHVSEVLSYADGAIVGSHLVKQVADSLDDLNSAHQNVIKSISLLARSKKTLEVKKN